MEVLTDILMKFLVVIVFLVAVIYVAQAIFLNKFNKLIYGKRSIKAWIPIANLYLLGKLTFSKMLGWILVLSTFLNSSLTVSVNDKERVYYFLPDNIRLPFSIMFSIAVFIVFICAIIKYNHLKKVQKELEKNQMTNYEQKQNLNPPVSSVEKVGSVQSSAVSLENKEPQIVNEVIEPVVPVVPEVQQMPSVPQTVIPNSQFVQAGPEFVLPEIVSPQPEVQESPEVVQQVQPQPENVNV